MSERLPQHLPGLELRWLCQGVIVWAGCQGPAVTSHGIEDGQELVCTGDDGQLLQCDRYPQQVLKNAQALHFGATQRGPGSVLSSRSPRIAFQDEHRQQPQTLRR